MEQEYRGYTIKIEQDTDCESPRTGEDNMGVMICLHNRYNLGDKHDLSNNCELDSWTKVKEHIEKENNVAVILPLWLYDHSGLSIKVGDFAGMLPQGHAEFDTMPVGFIYATKETVIKEYGEGKEGIARAEKYLKGEVETYNQYLSGDVWGFIVEDEDGEHIDSCWGFYGSEYAEEEAKAVVDAKVKEHGEQLKMELK